MYNVKKKRFNRVVLVRRWERISQARKKKSDIKWEAIFFWLEENGFWKTTSC